MKRVICIFVLVTTMRVQAGYDYVISEYGPNKTLQDTESILITENGGMDSLTLYDSSMSVIMGTSPLNEFSGGIWSLTMGGQSQLAFQGGQVNQISLHTSAIATFSGGRIDNIYSYQSAWEYEGQPPVLVPNPHIEMFVRDWDFNELTRRLTGTWGDFSTFDIKLIDVQGYSPTIDNIKFTIIPEPLSLILLALGGLIIRRNRFLKQLRH